MSDIPQRTIEFMSQYFNLDHPIEEFCAKMELELIKAEKERDEARTTIEDAKRALNATDYEGILLASLRVKEERDEARDQVQQMSESNQVLMADVRFYRNAWEQLKEGAK